MVGDKLDIYWVPICLKVFMYVMCLIQSFYNHYKVSAIPNWETGRMEVKSD
jgi:hypothetical protein